MDRIDTFSRITKNRDIRAAIEFQKSLASSVILKNQAADYKTICAFDISYEKSTRTNFAAAIVMSYPALETMDKIFLIQEAGFPYVPGLLAFREGQAILDLYAGLNARADLLLFDGHGIAHPRGLGIAALIGVLLSRPSIGCAKTCLVGEYDEPDRGKGSHTDLLYSNKIVGHVLRTRSNVKPIFVSVGHMIQLETATKIALRCCPGYRIPEPIRQAHKLANEIRKKHLLN